MNNITTLKLRAVVPGLLWTNDTITVSKRGSAWVCRVRGVVLIGTNEESFGSRAEMTRFLARNRRVRVVLAAA
jgi:hypothetical protein